MHGKTKYYTFAKRIISIKMMNNRLLTVFILLFSFLTKGFAQTYTLEGTVKKLSDSLPVPYAAVVLGDNRLWTVTDEVGHFCIKNVPEGKIKITVQCLGFVKREFFVTNGISALKIFLQEDNLKISQVTVTAQKNTSGFSAAYTLDRKALDHQQILNISDVNSLLPGGKTVNSTLMDDNRTALRSGSAEIGNSSFATAVEVDGARLSNNAELDETAGASTRNVSSTNIESIEIITGIPSVEYGDLSNGIVKVHTKKGKTPFVIDFSTNPYTKQAALSKGFDLKGDAGELNLSFEHTKSFTDISSPYTSYQRNVFDVTYSNTFKKTTENPLMFSFAASGNSGGYNSEADPDAFSENYTYQRDYVARFNSKIAWLLNKKWITNFNAFASLSIADKTTETNTNKNSASTSPYVHSTEEGYFIAADYDENPLSPVILSPTGYWYVKEFVESKPLDFSLKIKGDLVKHFSSFTNKFMLGSEYTSSGNLGRGKYYDDMRYAPDGWREYRYDCLPFMNNLAVYAEDKISVPLAQNTLGSDLQITLGLRDDLTLISGSDYGKVSSFSPRFSAKYIFWHDKKKTVKELSVYLGYGKSVKLPSFQVLYSRPSYYDQQVFSSTSSTDGKAFYAYYTYPVSAIRNKDLKWQYSNQTEIGAEINISDIKISISAYYNKTARSYISVYDYTPFTYNRTYSSALENSQIPSENRMYSIDRNSGEVTVSDKSGVNPTEKLPFSPKNTYKSATFFTNSNPVTRYGADWIIDFPQIKVLKTSLRLDGNYYRYKGANSTLLAYWPNMTSLKSDGTPFDYIGYYAGSSNTSTSLAATNSYYNGMLKKQINQNCTFMTHIPKVRMIISLRFEATLYRFSKLLIDSGDYGYNVAYASGEKGSTTGLPYNKDMRDFYVTVYPVYYSTWENPNELIPFAEKYLWAKNNDPDLYADLTKLTNTTNYGYNYNPEKISAYYSANFSITKEIGERASLSFYANNFFCHDGKVKSSKTGLDISLYGSGYIPVFYYGMSLRIKL